MIAGAGHDLSLERPRELATRVADFFDACERPSSRFTSVDSP
jgi:hypothetical protein